MQLSLQYLAASMYSLRVSPVEAQFYLQNYLQLIKIHIGNKLEDLRHNIYGHNCLDFDTWYKQQTNKLNLNS